MKRLSIACMLMIACVTGYAQTPEDALRAAWFVPSGSARNIAVGGIMASLGGDISANHINPAGLGLYRTREFVITPGYAFNENKFNYRDSLSANKKNAFNYGTIGVVVGFSGNGKWKNQAFSLSVNQMASFNNETRYKGFNNYSSFSEQYLEELTRDGADTIAAMNNYIFGSSLAFNTYLLDTINNDAGVFSGYKSLVPLGSNQNPFDGVMQERHEITRGGYHEIAIGYAGNMEDKLYVGGSLNFPIISYQRELRYKETDATNNPNNNFGFFEYYERLKSNGFGVGLKLGFIYKPKDQFRVGFAFHTPSILTYKDEIRSSMTTNTEGFKGTRTETSDNLNDGRAGTREYRSITPWRAIASASYVFREVANTKKQRAFLSADIEYVHYRGSRYYVMEDMDATGKAYYDAVNGAIKDYYKGNFNFKLGGELKFDPIMFRLGAAYYGSPYKDKQLDASRTVLSGGIGFRKYGFFVDLTYAHIINKDVSFPYRLNDVANTYAVQTGSRGMALVTFGFKF